MDDIFVQNALNKGKEGKVWLDSIPNIIKGYEEKWSIKVAPPFTLSYNYVAPAKTKDGRDVVLKIGFPKDKEFQTEISALEVFNGDGAEKLLEKDKDNAVILIERVTPGNPLSLLKNDKKATQILAEVMKKLWKPLPPNSSFISLREWIRALPLYLQQHSKKGPLPLQLVEKANVLFNELIATSAKPVLIHGDLHQDNVLSSDRSDWLAIDPKGIAAEPCYETAAMIRNPYEKMKNIADLEPILRKRILILSEKLDFEPQRILKYCFAQTILSAVWNHEEAKGSEHAIKIAEVLNTLEF